MYKYIRASAIRAHLHEFSRQFQMENGTEGLFYQGRASKIEAGLEVDNIYQRIEALSSEQRAQLIRKMIAMLTVEELADALDEIATKLRNTNS